MELDNKHLEFLEKAQRKINLASHFIYVAYPLFPDKRFLIKTIFELRDCFISCINSVLFYESFSNKNFLLKNPMENLEFFKNKFALKYRITLEEINFIFRIFNLTKKCEDSNFEFRKNNKVVFLLNDLRIEVISVEEMRIFIEKARQIFRKIKINF